MIEKAGWVIDVTTDPQSALTVLRATARVPAQTEIVGDVCRSTFLGPLRHSLHHLVYFCLSVVF